MAYELAEYYGGAEASEAQKAGLAKAREVAAKNRKARKAAALFQEYYSSPIVMRRPPFEYSTEVKKVKPRCRPLKENSKRSLYMGCKLNEFHSIPCEYRTKENAKALSQWAIDNCPKKPKRKRISSALEQIKNEAKRLGISMTYIRKDGKRRTKTKKMLNNEIAKAYGS